MSFCLITVLPNAGEWEMPHIYRNKHFYQMTDVTYWWLYGRAYSYTCSVVVPLRKGNHKIAESFMKNPVGLYPWTAKGVVSYSAKKN